MENYGNIQKTMALWKEKLWYYGKNNWTIPRTMELLFTNEKTMVDY